MEKTGGTKTGANSAQVESELHDWLEYFHYDGVKRDLDTCKACGHFLMYGDYLQKKFDELKADFPDAKPQRVPKNFLSLMKCELCDGCFNGEKDFTHLVVDKKCPCYDTHILFYWNNKDEKHVGVLRK